jgi:hypothetical protein
VRRDSPLEALDRDLLDVPHCGGWARARADCLGVEGVVKMTVSMRVAVRSCMFPSGHDGSGSRAVKVKDGLVARKHLAHDALRDATSAPSVVAALVVSPRCQVDPSPQGHVAAHFGFIVARDTGYSF